MSRKQAKHNNERKNPKGKVSTRSLVRAIAKRTGVTQVDTDKVIKALIAQIQMEVFDNNNQVSLVNLGKFWRKEVKPNNNEIIKRVNSSKKMKPKYALTFRTSANIRHKLANRVKKDSDSII